MEIETIGTKVRKSSKELGDHGLQFLTDTKQAGQSFVSFVQDEAKDWGEYLRHRYQTIEEQGRELIKTENPRDAIKVHLDSLIGKIKSRSATTEEQVDEETPETTEAVAAAEATTEEVTETAEAAPADEAEEDFTDAEELEEDFEDEE